MPEVGPQIRDLREGLGFSPTDMAERANLPVDRVREIESGGNLTTQELAALAMALGTDPPTLLMGRLGDPRRSVARFRSAQGVAPLLSDEPALTAADLRLLSLAAEVGRLGAHLRNLLELPPSPIGDERLPCAVRAYPDAWEQGYELGRKARRRRAPAPGPIESIQRELEAAVIHVAFVTFEASGIEAASLFESGSVPVVLLNKSAPRVRYPLSRRAILAHELCHLLHDGGERDLLTVVSRNTDDSPVEQRANGFAPSFIAPGPSVRPRRGEKLAVVVDLATTWGLSFEGAVWHASNLDHISSSTAKKLLRGRKPTIRSNFEPDIPRTPPGQFDIESEPSDLANGLFSEIAIMALAEGLVSRGRATELLSLA